MCDVKVDCIGVPRGHGWVREAGVAICKSWGERPPKGAVRYLRNLAVLLNYRSQRSLIFTPNKRPRGTPILIGAGWRSQTIGEIFKGTDGACADPGTQNFPCHGVHPPAFQFYSSSFYVTHRFFVTFLTQKRNVPPFVPLYAAHFGRFFAKRSCNSWIKA